MSLTQPGAHSTGPPSGTWSTARTASLTEEQADAYVHGICFKTGPPSRVGVELEWLVHDTGDPTQPVDTTRLTSALAAPATSLRNGRLPRGALLTREPGGQVELSSPPAASLSECVSTVQRDLDTLRTALCDHDLQLAGYGHDLWRPPRRTLDLPRYAAMEEFFDRTGPAGRSMMCATASVQVCLDAGTEAPGPHGYARRWRLAHLLGPVLVAAFANSPLVQGRPSGWRSTRQAVWARLDPSRTLAPTGRDPRTAWTRYALDATLLCVRNGEAHPWTAPEGVTFRKWVRGGGGTGGGHGAVLHPPRRAGEGLPRPRGDGDPHDSEPNSGDASSSGTGFNGTGFNGTAPGRPPHPSMGSTVCPQERSSAEPFVNAPSADDLAYHLTTLFPPVRPRGHLELRMIDAQPGEDGWLVPLAVVTALFEDQEASTIAERVAGRLAAPGPPAPRNPLWLRAARHGLADPVLRSAAQTCFAAAEAALPRLDAPPEARAAVGRFTRRYIRRGRCPADDLLDALPARSRAWKESFPC